MHLKLVLSEVISSQYVIILIIMRYLCTRYYLIDAIGAIFYMLNLFNMWLLIYQCLVFIKSKV